MTDRGPGGFALKSAGALAFSPQGIQFVGDARAVTLYALNASDRPEVEAIDEKIANLLSTEPKELQICDLAVNPISGTTCLAVARGMREPALVRAERSGKLGELPLSF